MKGPPVIGKGRPSKLDRPQMYGTIENILVWSSTAFVLKVLLFWLEFLFRVQSSKLFKMQKGLESPNS
jgi:hypothetical protein